LDGRKEIPGMISIFKELRDIFTTYATFPMKKFFMEFQKNFLFHATLLILLRMCKMTDYSSAQILSFSVSSGDIKKEEST